ncbi:MAG: hypothetical protein AAGF81_19405 [Pseudomonadota bacterium]
MKYLSRACLIAALSLVGFGSPAWSEDKTPENQSPERPTLVGLSHQDTEARMFWDQTDRALTVPLRLPNTPGQSTRERGRLPEIEWVTHNGEITLTRRAAARHVLSIDAVNNQTVVTGVLVGSRQNGGYLAVALGKSGLAKLGLAPQARFSRKISETRPARGPLATVLSSAQTMSLREIGE